MDPKQVRMAANMMKNMNNSDIDNLKNMAQNKSFVPPVNPIPNQPEANATANNSSSSFPKIEKFKNQGNEFFKQGSFQNRRAVLVFLPSRSLDAHSVFFSVEFCQGKKQHHQDFRLYNNRSVFCACA